MLVLILMFALLVLFIVDWALHYRTTRRFWACGFLLAALLLLLELGVIFTLPKGVDPLQMVTGMTGAVVSFFRVALFTVVGMYSCVKLRRPHLPLVSALFGENHFRRRVRWDDCLLVGAVVTIGALAYTIALFTLTGPRLSSIITGKFGEALRPSFAAEGSYLMAGLLVVAFALGEELVFRLGIQSFLARHLKLKGRKYWIAILATTILWTLGHAGVMEPAWVKFAQVFPLGIALGILFWRYGVEITIGVHAVYNVVMMLLAPLLVQT
jgi:membrane protease YdiL (CAAX protease family)